MKRFSDSVSTARRTFTAVLFVCILALAFVFMFGKAQPAMADENNASAADASIAISSEASSSEVLDLNISPAETGLKIWDMNGGDPNGTAIQIGSRMEVRVAGVTSDNITWTSSNPAVVKVSYGASSGHEDNSECTLLASGIGNCLISVKNGDQVTQIRIHVQQVNITSDGYYWTAPANCTYSGAALKPLVGIAGNVYTVVSGDVRQSTGLLREGTDYTVTYSNNTNIGTATAVVTGIGLYTGTRTFTFKIEAAPSGNTGNSGGNGSGNNSSQAGIAGESGATVVVPTTPPAATNVSGAWKKSGGKWWFSYDKKTASALGKPWPSNEWVTIGGKRYHFNSKGYMNTGWFHEGTNWYWLGSDGAMKTGWNKTGGKWYYMASDGKMQTGKKLIGTLVYFLRDSGAMVTGWNKEKLGWFYYTSSGAMKTGWLKTGGKWYYLSPANGIMQTGWLTLGKSTYYLNSSGAMLTGWHKLTKDGKASWYYFNKSGVMQKDKWIGNYYVKSDGVMAMSEWIGKYHVNASGKWDATK